MIALAVLDRDCGPAADRPRQPGPGRGRRVRRPARRSSRPACPSTGWPAGSSSSPTRPSTGGRRPGGGGRHRHRGRALRAVRGRSPQGRRARRAGPGPAPPPRRRASAWPATWASTRPCSTWPRRGPGPPSPRPAGPATVVLVGPGVDRPRRLRRLREAGPAARRRPGPGPRRAGVRGHVVAVAWRTPWTGPTGWAPTGWRSCPLFLFSGVLVDRIGDRAAAWATSRPGVTVTTAGRAGRRRPPGRPDRRALRRGRSTATSA